MIVISGALVLVAAVLLVLGIVSSITLVYAAIGLSLVSAVFLLVGVFQRPLPAADRREADGDETRAAPVRMSKPVQEPVHEQPVEAHPQHEAQYSDFDEAADYPLEAANAEYEERAGATGADVLVISGRPRYHVGGCEYVEGNDDSEPIEILEARELGFTPCGVCRPNETLARSAAGREHAEAPAPVVSEPPVAAAVTAPVTVAAPAVSAVHSNGANGDHAAPVTVEQPAVPAAAPVSAPVAQAAPAPPAAPETPAAAPVPPAAPPVAATPPPVAEPVVTPTRPRARARARRPADPIQEPLLQAPEPEPVAPPEPEPPAPRARISGRTVLAVAETKEYHRANCSQLEGIESEELTKGAAIRQGYLACGVCKP